MATKTDEIKILINAEVDKALKNFRKVGKATDTAGKKAGKFGDVLRAVGAGFAVKKIIDGIIGASKAAIDAQEIFSKFKTVFRDVSRESEKVAKDLVENFGLSRKEAKGLLADTGDLLSGFGFTGEAALDLAEKTNKLAVDLASFTNIEGGAERASKALTKALLGERESAKELGIAILETDVQQRLLEKGQKNLTGTALKQAKAQATLEIAMEQSKNAIGDYARTSEQAANQSKLFRSRIQDVVIQFGENLLPIITPLLQKLNKFLTWLINIDSPLKDFVMISGLVAGGIAAIGLAVTALIPLVTALGITMKAALIGTGIGAAIGVIAAGAFLIIKNWTSIVTFFKKLGLNIEKIFLNIKLAIVEKFGDAINAVIRFINKAITQLNKLPKVNLKTLNEIDSQTKKSIDNRINEIDRELKKFTQAEEKKTEKAREEQRKRNEENLIIKQEGNQLIKENEMLFEEEMKNFRDQKRIEEITAQLMQSEQIKNLANSTAKERQKIAENMAKQIVKTEKELGKAIVKETDNWVDKANEIRHTMGELANTIADMEIEAIQRSAEAGEISKEEAARKTAKIKEKQIKANAIQSSADIAINSAIAIIKAYADLGPIAGSVMTGVIAALAVAQQSVVAAQAKKQLNALPKFAAGGVMPYTGMAMVGEQGPEAVALPAGARVFNNSETNEIMNDNGITIQNLTVRANDPEQFFNELQQYQRQNGLLEFA
jgi:hypothetical protein